MAVDWKRLALHPSDHGLLDDKATLWARIERYVTVRRERGELMKVIVPAAAKRFGVSEETVWSAPSARLSRKVVISVRTDRLQAHYSAFAGSGETAAQASGSDVPEAAIVTSSNHLATGREQAAVSVTRGGLSTAAPWHCKMWRLKCCPLAPPLLATIWSGTISARHSSHSISTNSQQQSCPNISIPPQYCAAFRIKVQLHFGARLKRRTLAPSMSLSTACRSMRARRTVPVLGSARAQSASNPVTSACMISAGQTIMHSKTDTV